MSQQRRSHRRPTATNDSAGVFQPHAEPSALSHRPAPAGPPQGHQFAQVALFPEAPAAETGIAEEAQRSAPSFPFALGSAPQASFDTGSIPPSPPPAAPPGQPPSFLIQARLRVNPVGDVYEQEADRVAALVMQMPNDGEQETTTPAPLQVQTARSADAGVGPVEPAVEDRITALRGRGQPLPASEQAFFSERLGHSFANVRIHHDSESDALANALQAEAFTVGSDIVFRNGTFTPGDRRSRELVAHELTHVIQQTGGEPTAGQSSGTVQAKRAIQRTSAAGEGVCPVCGKTGKGTCPDCGSPFLPVQRKVRSGFGGALPFSIWAGNETERQEEPAGLGFDQRRVRAWNTGSTSAQEQVAIEQVDDVPRAEGLQPERELHSGRDVVLFNKQTLPHQIEADEDHARQEAQPQAEQPAASASTKPLVSSPLGAEAPKQMPIDDLVRPAAAFAALQTHPVPVAAPRRLAIEGMAASPEPVVAVKPAPLASIATPASQASSAPAAPELAPAPLVKPADPAAPVAPSADAALTLTADAALAPSLAGMSLDEAWAAMQEHIGATKATAHSAVEAKQGGMLPVPAAVPPERSAAPAVAPSAPANEAEPAVAPVPTPSIHATPAPSALDVADAAAEQVLREEAQRPEVVIQRFGLGDVADTLMPDWVEGALEALRGEARSNERELTGAGGADKSTIDADAQSKGAEIQGDGQSKGTEVQADGQTKSGEVQGEGDTKSAEIQGEGDIKGAEVEREGQTHSTELANEAKTAEGDLQTAQDQQTADLQTAQDQQAVDLQTAQDQQAVDLQAAQDQQTADLQTAQEQTASDLQREAEREQAGIDAEAQTQQTALQQQYATTEQAVQQRQADLSNEVEQRANAIQGEVQQLEGDAQTRWATLHGEAHTTMGLLNTQASELCASAQGQAQAFLDSFDPLLGDAQSGWQKIQTEAKRGWDALMQQAQPMLDTLQSKWSEFSTWFSTDAWPVIQQKATELGQFVSEQATQAWGWLQEQWGNLSNVWNNAESIIQGKADTARAFIAGRVEAAQLWIGGKADTARLWIGDKADAARLWIGDKVEAARLWIGDKADVARTWIGDKAGTARLWIGDKADTARLSIGDKADTARTWIGERGDAARSWIGERGDAARSWIDDKSALAQQWLQGRATSITATFREAGDGLVSGLAGKARGAVSAITSGGGPILEWFGSIVNGLIGGVERAGHGAVSLASGAVSGGLGVVERAASGAMHGLSGLAHGAVNTVQGAATGAVNTVQDAATGAVKGVEMLGTGAVTAVEGAATSAVNGVETLGTGAVTAVEGAATNAVNGVQSLGTGAVTFVEGRAQGAVTTVETAASGAVDAVGAAGRGVVTGLEQQALLGMQLARAAWDDIQKTWNAATRTAGQVLGWLGEQAGRLGNWLGTEAFPRLWGWASEQWANLSGWVAEQFPALAACWKAFEQFGEAAWEKIQKVPLLGDYLRLSGELLEGMIAGDALQNPTALNIAGQILIGFTPIGWVGDARDIGLALYRLAKGEGNTVDALIAVAAIVPGLDALKGIKGGAKLLDHADEAAEGLKLLQDALKGLPPGVTDGILKNPELMAQLAKNPGLLDEALRHGEEGVLALVRGGEQGLAAMREVDDGIDEMASWGQRANSSNASNNNTFSSNYEGLEWFDQRYLKEGEYHPIARLRGDYFGPKLEGARQDVMEQSLDEIDYLMYRYPEASANLENIAVKNRLEPYPSGSDGKIFDAHAAAISGRESLLIREIWLSKELFGSGQLQGIQITNEGGKSIAFPGGDKVNFSALMAHEYGHAVHRWLQSSEMHEDVITEIELIIANHSEELKKITPASFAYAPKKLPNEIFAELFASRRVLQDFESGYISKDLVPNNLLDEEIRSLVFEFSELLDNWISVARNL